MPLKACLVVIFAPPRVEIGVNHVGEHPPMPQELVSARRV